MNINNRIKRKLVKLSNICAISGLLFALSFFFLACKKSVEVNYLEKITEVKSYHLTGVMESYHNQGSSNCNFEVYSKGDSQIRVELTKDSSKQYVIKNKDEVYIMMPQINKSFKVDGSWPNNSSYPYLLQSISKDIANSENVITTETKDLITFEVDCSLFRGSKKYKEKIEIDKNTLLPKEIKIFKEDTLITRCIITLIDVNCEIDDSKFSLDECIKENEESQEVSYNRTYRIPSYIPFEMNESNKYTQVVNSKTCIMKFEGDNSFTIIQDRIYKDLNNKTESINGSPIDIMGVVGFLDENKVMLVFNGIIYTILSDNVDSEGLIDIVSSYVLTVEK